MAQQISALPPAPLLTDTPEVFDPKAVTFNLALSTFRTEANALAVEAEGTVALAAEQAGIAQAAASDAQVYIDGVAADAEAEITRQVGIAQAAASDAQASEVDAYESAQIAQSVANFKGRWEDLSGALAVPASVFYNDIYYNLLEDVPNVSAVVPGVSSAWAEIRIIQEISRPAPIAPLNGATCVVPTPTLEASSYLSIYSPDVRDYREFQVDASNGDFSTPVYEFQGDVDNHTVPTPLPLETSLKWRCRDVSVRGRVSLWSSVQTFATGSVTVAQPTLTVLGAPSDVPEAPLLTTSAFNVLGGTDTHLNTDWQVLDDQITVVWESLADAANKLSIEVPSGILQTSSTYTFRARHRGMTYGVSTWVSVTATTRASFNPVPDFIGPGAQEMVAYDPVTDTGYYGEVAVADLFTGDALAAAIGLSAGTSQHSTSGWLKFYVGANASCYRPEDAPVAGQGYVVFIAKRPYRNNLSWDSIYQTGAVYGVNNNGLYPTGTPQNQLTTVTTGGNTFKVQLMTGAEDDPTSWTGTTPTDPVEGETSYWNELMYRVHVDVPARLNGVNWDSLTDSDIAVALGDGRASWMQETRADSTSLRVNRGLLSLLRFDANGSSVTNTPYGWRPMLVITP